MDSTYFTLDNRVNSGDKPDEHGTGSIAKVPWSCPKMFMKEYAMSKFLRLSALILCLSAGAARAQFFTCSGTNILGPDQAPFRIRGNALSHWNNAEGYALKLTSVHWRHLGSESSLKSRIRDIVGEANADRFWSAYGSNFVTEADIADLKAEGFNTIRLPFNYRLVSPAATPGVYSEEGFAALDQIIAWCRTNDLYVILDMHACPGGQSHDAPADPEWAYWYWNAGVTNWLETGVACLWVSSK